MPDNQTVCWTDDRGLTVLELMIVLVILSLIGVVASVQVIHQLDRAKVDIARLQLTQMESGLELFFLDVGRYPQTDEGLQSLISKPNEISDWRGPYLSKAELLNDPWHEPILYESSDPKRYFLVSRGSDRKEGGEGVDADISVGEE